MKNLFNLHYQERDVHNLSINMSNKDNVIYCKFRTYNYIKDGFIWDDIHQESINILGLPLYISHYRIFGIYHKDRTLKIKELTTRRFNPDSISNL